MLFNNNSGGYTETALRYMKEVNDFLARKIVEADEDGITPEEFCCLVTGEISEIVLLVHRHKLRQAKGW